MRPARYGLRGDDRMAALAQWYDMDGFFVSRESALDAYENPTEELQTVRVAVHGIDWLDRATPSLTLPAGVLEVLGADGHVVGDYALWDVELAGPDQAVLTASLEALPHAGARWAWDRWREGRPGQRGVWAGMPVGEREGWLEVARIVGLRENRTPYPPLGSEHEIDGSHIEDLASFFCAVGEALAGPGGYCGASFADLADCLRFAPRAVERPRLVWRDMAVAEKGLDRLMDTAVGTLAGGGLDVVPS